MRYALPARLPRPSQRVIEREEVALILALPQGRQRVVEIGDTALVVGRDTGREVRIVHAALRANVDRDVIQRPPARRRACCCRPAPDRSPRAVRRDCTRSRVPARAVAPSCTSSALRRSPAWRICSTKAALPTRIAFSLRRASACSALISIGSGRCIGAYQIADALHELRIGIVQRVDLRHDD
jgi:hypothetical protein